MMLTSGSIAACLGVVEDTKHMGVTGGLGGDYSIAALI